MIEKPTLLLDEQKCRYNIETMCLKAQVANVDFRPHFKTHQSSEIGTWFKALGVDKITVSSLTMAEYFAPEWKDITVAFPVNILEIDTINRLAEKIQLNLLIQSPDTACFLERQLRHEVSFFIKMDVGYHRAGLEMDDTATIEQILAVSKRTDKLTFKGFLAHAGHTYQCTSQKAVLDIHQKSLAAMAALKQQYSVRYPDIIVSTGDTPGCTIADDFSGSDEIRPGNFVFFDLMQHFMGVCDIRQVAVAMACPVVAVNKGRSEIVIYGGGVHFSKEGIKSPNAGMTFGAVVEQQGGGWGDIIPGMHIKSLSQEHGIVSVPEAQIENYQAGDCLLIIPIHSCMTADAMRAYTSTADSRIIKRL